MKATIVTIGDEILIGQIVDTNSAFIAKALDRIGIETTEMLSISDDRSHILDTFRTLQGKVELVVITGGLGPTKDDITKKTFCDYFDDVLISDPKVLEHVENLFFQYTGKRELLQVNIDQALVPSKSEVLFNKMGTAPGMWMKKDNTVFVSLPGVPYEMKYLIEEVILPKLIREYDRPHIIHKTIMTYGQGESLIAERIKTWEDNLPASIKLAYLPAPGRVRLRLTARGNDKQALEQAIAAHVTSLSQLIGDIIVGFDEDQSIEVVLQEQMAAQGLTLATAESCTGGKIAQLLTSVAGASKYFYGSVVAYQEVIKTEILGVDAAIIGQHTVVSAQVAEAMAQNVRRLFKTDYGIGVTGNAGPTADKTDEEVGVVYLALASPDGVRSAKFNFGQPREKVIDRSVNKALELLLKEISKK